MRQPRLVVNGEVYKVTFLNALDQVVKSIDYEVYTGLPKIIPPTAEEMEVPGYRFLGEFDKSWDNITGDTVIKGVYVKTYVVSFYNGIDSEPISTQVLDAGEDAVEPSEEDRYVEGYFFKGWDRDFTNVQSDLNVNGFYIRGYIFEYDFENMDENWYWHDCGYIRGSVEPGTCVAPGTKITLSVEPDFGYAFLGWYLDDMLVSEDLEYTFLMLTRDVTLVARVAKDHECVDESMEHLCDYCAAVLSAHEDKNLDHLCDCYGEECLVGYFGEHADSEDDNDHYCDYCQWGEPLSACVDVDPKDHFCDICGDPFAADMHADGEIVDHHCDYCGEKLSECVDEDPEDHFCDICGAVIDGNGMCVDADMDHDCDICGEDMSMCCDVDLDHICDYCKVWMSEHVDCDRDHYCDWYGDDCQLGYFGVCEDADKDHFCDYGCGYFFGEHCDANKDHLCDYGCQIIIGWHEDSDWDHRCDFCGARLTCCEDHDRDHRCDICGAEMGKCVDADIDHRCDYGCGAMIGEHADSEDDNDHYCDYCGMLYDFNYGMRLEECFDLDKNHFCDVCGYAIGVHADSEDDNDHYCDYCYAVLSECEDVDRDHICDYCGDTISACVNDEAYDHFCDICGRQVTQHVDGNKDHVCDNGCSEAIGTHADSNKDHVCDYGCSEAIGAHEDVNPVDDKCDYCGEPMNEHEHVDAIHDHVCDVVGCNAEVFVDDNKDHYCDLATCGRPRVGDKHNDTNGDGICDYCGRSVSNHEHVDTNPHDFVCDEAGCEVEVFVDENMDHFCDCGCGNFRPGDRHVDTNGDGFCDYCGEFIGYHEHVDTDPHDHRCDDAGCNEAMWPDENKDHFCDICGTGFGRHIDDDHDAVCDYCNKTIN